MSGVYVTMNVATPPPDSEGEVAGAKTMNRATPDPETEAAYGVATLPQFVTVITAVSVVPKHVVAGKFFTQCSVSQTVVPKILSGILAVIVSTSSPLVIADAVSRAVLVLSAAGVAHTLKVSEAPGARFIGNVRSVLNSDAFAPVIAAPNTLMLA